MELINLSNETKSYLNALTKALNGFSLRQPHGIFELTLTDGSKAAFNAHQIKSIYEWVNNLGYLRTRIIFETSNWGDSAVVKETYEEAVAAWKEALNG